MQAREFLWGEWPQYQRRDKGQVKGQFQRKLRKRKNSTLSVLNFQQAQPQLVFVLSITMQKPSFVIIIRGLTFTNMLKILLFNCHFLYCSVCLKLCLLKVVLNRNIARKVFQYRRGKSCCPFSNLKFKYIDRRNTIDNRQS